MRYVLLGLLLLVLAVILLAMVVTWYQWTVFLHIWKQGVVVELRGFGMKRRIIDRAFDQTVSDDGKSTAKKKTKSENKPKKKQSGITERFSRDKKRIYDPEHGGFSMDGLQEVVGEYRELFYQTKEVLHGFFGDIRYRISVPSTDIRLEFGTGNPAHTGMIYGWIWSGVGFIYPLVCRYIRMEYPRMDVTPDYYGERFEYEVKSIIKVRPAHIINAALKQVLRQAITYCYKHLKKEV